RKLLRIARQQASDEAAVEASNRVEPLDPTTAVDELLVWLSSQGYLDENRFVESRLHARTQRFGLQRIKQELTQHGLSLDAEQQQAVKAGEYEQARAIWLRKFGPEPDQEAAARAKQTRFLIGRGFSAETIRRLLRGRED
ncbi:MAG TPA: regulatory protein RecX, partial [Burkholderiaceae bacterium]